MSISDASILEPTRTGRDLQSPPLILSDLDLIARQLLALERWHAARREQEQVLAAPGQSREQRLVSQRRLSALAAVHQAVIARCDEAGGDPDGRRPGRPRAVLAHRNLWLRGKVGAELEGLGVTVIASVDDGAEAVAAVLCTQPEVVLVEDRLPTVPGYEVVAATADYAPHTVIAVQADGQEDVGHLLDAGVRAWFSRRIPPADVARRLVQALQKADGDVIQLP